MSTRSLSVLLILTFSVALFFVAGCAGRPASAQKLFDKGEYQKVIDQYPDLEIARRARAKMAEDLLKKQDYAAILRDYRDTPAAFKAKQEMAQKMFEAGRYQAVIDSFPTSVVAPMAREKLADSLFAAGQLEQLLLRYPDSQKGKQVKEDKATEALKQAKKLRGKAKDAALEAMMQQYAGTAAYGEASQLLKNMREAEANKKKK